MDNKRYAVAIDGPSGAGKSTLAKAAAAELGIRGHLPHHRPVRLPPGGRPA